jgi:hypothetical protein
MSVLNVYLALCTDEIDAQAYEFMEQNKEFVCKYYGQVLNNSTKAKATSPPPSLLLGSQSSDTSQHGASFHSAPGQSISVSKDYGDDIPMVEGSDDEEDDKDAKEEKEKDLKRSLSKQKSFMNLMKPKLKKSGTLKDLMSSMGMSIGSGRGTKAGIDEMTAGGQRDADDDGAVFKLAVVTPSTGAMFDSGGFSSQGPLSPLTVGAFHSLVDDLNVPNPLLFLQTAEKSVFLLRLNEKVMWSLGRCLFLLAEEYKRALQRKHWDRAEPGSVEETANLFFVLSVGNDAFRVLNVYVKGQTHVKTITKPALEFLRDLFPEFIAIMEMTSR